MRRPQSRQYLVSISALPASLPGGPGQTLCILEAMKLMNEVKADVEGVIKKIHVQNGQPVEFGQALFDLDPVLARPLDAL